MSQMCINPRQDHVPVIERYYDEDQPTLVKRIFRCELCAYIMGEDVIEKTEEEYDHAQDFKMPDQG